MLRVGRMREEEEPSWFGRFDEDLPSPDELIPLSHWLITRDLPAAFNIPTHGAGRSAILAKERGSEASPGNASMKDGGFPSPLGNTSMNGGGGGGGSARTSRSSDCRREELRRNLDDVAGLTNLFSEVPAAAVVLFFFFLDLRVIFLAVMAAALAFLAAS